MTGTRQIRDWWHEDRCTYGVKTNMFGRTPIYAQETEWVRALEQAHYGAGYYPTPGGYIGSRRNCPAGIAGKPCQQDGDDCSLHNYGLAWDIEYNYNPHFRRSLSDEELWDLFDQGRTKYNPDIINVIYQVKNMEGERMFSSLAQSIGDTMHWQINVHPDRRQVDWSTVPNTDGEGMMRNGSSGTNVQKWQNYLNRWNTEHLIGLPPLVEDGDFGDSTEGRTESFQGWANIEQTGMVGYMDTGTMAIAIKIQTGSDL